MTNKTLALVLGICLLLFFSCSGTDDLPEIKSEIINGTKNVFNSFAPLKGQIVLNLEMKSKSIKLFPVIGFVKSKKSFL